MTDNLINNLQECLKNEPGFAKPWTTGTIRLDSQDRTIYYTQKDNTHRFVTCEPSLLDVDIIARRIQLGSPNANEDAKELTEACHAATFGLDHEDVLDESYRKAGKLDFGDWSWLFVPETSGKFMSKLVTGLFPFTDLTSGIRVEPYKLNVYETGSFFKPHVDTPRGQNMSGSLVVVLPFAHSGGNLILRHRGPQLDFDASMMLKEAVDVSAAYVAFYSDVEHEVLPVTSGHRVTITYNLYFDESKSPVKKLKIDGRSPDLAFNLEKVLKTCLQDPQFIPRHKGLGFGLQHKYPSDRNTRETINIRYLKGIDAIIALAFERLGFTPEVRYVYQHQNPDYDLLSKYPVLSDSGAMELDPEERLPDELLLDQNDKCVVWTGGPTDQDQHKRRWGYKLYDDKELMKKTLHVTWVVPRTGNLKFEDSYMHYGNESSLVHEYFDVCLYVDLTRRNFVPGLGSAM